MKEKYIYSNDTRNRKSILDCTVIEKSNSATLLNQQHAIKFTDPNDNYGEIIVEPYYNDPNTIDLNTIDFVSSEDPDEIID